MIIEITRKTRYQCAYLISRGDGSSELITLETKVYLLHDICHYVVEQRLRYADGFWGMLAKGHTFNELFGKTNPITAGLRYIEQIVGPVQSVFQGYLPKELFSEQMAHLNVVLARDFLDGCLHDIGEIIQRWEQLPVGQQMTLVWK